MAKSKNKCGIRLPIEQVDKSTLTKVDNANYACLKTNRLFVFNKDTVEAVLPLDITVKTAFSYVHADSSRVVATSSDGMEETIEYTKTLNADNYFRSGKAVYVEKAGVYIWTRTRYTSRYYSHQNESGGNGHNDLSDWLE